MLRVTTRPVIKILDQWLYVVFGHKARFGHFTVLFTRNRNHHLTRLWHERPDTAIKWTIFARASATENILLPMLLETVTEWWIEIVYLKVHQSPEIYHLTSQPIEMIAHEGYRLLLVETRQKNFLAEVAIMRVFRFSHALRSTYAHDRVCYHVNL